MTLKEMIMDAMASEAYSTGNTDLSAMADAAIEAFFARLLKPDVLEVMERQNIRVMARTDDSRECWNSLLPAAIAQMKGEWV